MKISFDQNINKQNEYIANYLALEITEFFFDNIMINNISIEEFLSEFKNKIKNTIKENINQEKIIVNNVFNYYALIFINKNIINKIKKEDFVFKSEKENSINEKIINCIEKYFFENENKILKINYKDNVVIFTPLVNLEKIVF